MNEAIYQKLVDLVKRLEVINNQLTQPEVIADQSQFRVLSKEYAQLDPIVRCFREYQKAQADIENAKALLSETDADLRLLAEEEMTDAKKRMKDLEPQLELLLLPKDPDDECNVFLEIRAAAGGHEAALFAGELFRMYARYAESKGWTVEIVSSSSGEQGGYKEVIARLSGEQVYAQLKFESGAHRVQRVPETEAQGRIHTSTCTVAVMPEIEEVGEIEIKPEDLRVDTYRASGAGGQHVNRTDSAVRITHLPTGVVVECQDERSQHKNRARAMSVLKAKLLQAERNRQRAEQAATRRSLVGTGDRSERIRTYNFPQNRITDHRINVTLYQLEDMMEGHLDPIIEPLIRAYRLELMESVKK